jgi:hypothetical protein
MDGGLTWAGLNQFLPNLPTRHLVGVPSGPRGVRLSLAGGGNTEIEWAPGEKTAWRAVESADLARENNTKAALSQVLKHSITAVATAKDYIYTGDSEGRMQAHPGRSSSSWPILVQWNPSGWTPTILASRSLSWGHVPAAFRSPRPSPLTYCGP